MGIIFTLLAHSRIRYLSVISMYLYTNIYENMPWQQISLIRFLKIQDIDLEKVELLLFKIVINILINQMLKLSCYYLYIGSTNINEKNSGEIWFGEDCTNENLVLFWSFELKKFTIILIIPSTFTYDLNHFYLWCIKQGS